MKTIRASKLPLNFACHASTIEPKIKIESTHPLALMGSAIHEVQSKIIVQNLEAIPDLYPIAKKYGIDDMKEFAILAWAGLRAWSYLRGRGVQPLGTEIFMESVIGGHKLSGTSDFIGKQEIEDHGKVAIVIDWKSGYVQQDATNQLMGYLYMFMEKHGEEFESAKIITVHIRSGDIDPVEVSKSDLDQWGKKFVEVMEDDQVYNPTEFCGFCPRAHECPARTTFVQNTILSLSLASENRGLSDPLLLAELYPKVKVIQRVLESYDSALKMAVQEHGHLELPDGRFLVFDESERETIDPAKMMGPLEKRFGKDLFGILCESGSLTIGKTKLMDAVKKQARKGMKGKEAESCMEELRDAGAVTTKTVRRLIPKKLK